jgi:hypothetical protein
MVSSRLLLSPFLALLIRAIPSSAFAASPLSPSRVLQSSTAASRERRQLGPLFAVDDNNNPFGFVQGLFSQQKGTAVVEPKTPAIPDVVVEIVITHWQRYLQQLGLVHFLWVMSSPS